MKKIKSIKQLQAEKRRIKEQLDHLENKMHNHWAELKYSLRPAGIIKNGFSSILKSKTESNLNAETLLKSALAFGVSLLVSRFAKKTSEKFGDIFKKKKKQHEPAD